MSDPGVLGIDEPTRSCPWCGAQVSASLLSCPHCQTPVGDAAPSRRSLPDVAVTWLCVAAAVRLLFGLWAAYEVRRAGLGSDFSAALMTVPWISAITGALVQASLLVGAAAALSIFRDQRLPRRGASTPESVKVPTPSS